MRSYAPSTPHPDHVISMHTFPLNISAVTVNSITTAYLYTYILTETLSSTWGGLAETVQKLCQKQLCCSSIHREPFSPWGTPCCRQDSNLWVGVTVQEVWAWNSEHVEEHRNSFGHVVLLPPSFLSLKYQEPLLFSIQFNLASVTNRNWIFVSSLFKCFWKHGKDVLSDCFIYLLCYFLLFTVEETEYQSFACIHTAVLAYWNLSYWNSHTKSVFFSIIRVHICTDAVPVQHQAQKSSLKAALCSKVFLSTFWWLSHSTL